MKFLSNVLSKETITAINDALGMELVGQIDRLLKDLSIDAAKEKLIPKATFDVERQKAADLATRIAERDSQLETLKKSSGDNATLSAQIKELQAANETAANAWQTKLFATEREFALKDSLKNTFKARDVLSVIPHLKQDAIVYKDGTFTGLKEQMEALSKDKAFLFETENVGQPGTGGAPFVPPVGGNTDPWSGFNFSSVRDGSDKK